MLGEEHPGAMAGFCGSCQGGCMALVVSDLRGQREDGECLVFADGILKSIIVLEGRHHTQMRSGS